MTLVENGRVSGVAAGSVTVGWATREPPLSACAVAAVGVAATRLLLALEKRLGGPSAASVVAGASGRLDGRGVPAGNAPAVGAPHRLSGVFGNTRRGTVVVILGEFDALPWVEGVTYLGRDPLAAGLLLPVLRSPLVPIEVYASAVRARVATDGLVACLEEGILLVPMVSARPLGIDEIRMALAARS